MIGVFEFAGVDIGAGVADEGNGGAEDEDENSLTVRIARALLFEDED